MGVRFLSGDNQLLVSLFVSCELSVRYMRFDSCRGPGLVLKDSLLLAVFVLVWTVAVEARIEFASHVEGGCRVGEGAIGFSAGGAEAAWWSSAVGRTVDGRVSMSIIKVTRKE